MTTGGERDDLKEQIDAEWDTYRRWIAAYSQGVESKPELPNQMAESKVSAWIGVPAMLVLVGFVVVGAMARRAHLHRVRAWAAEKEIALDHLWYEPKSCGLSKAYTRLGLAHLALGNKSKAIECLDRSFQVHPCPHNVNFGLPSSLWSALANVPDAQPARRQCKEIATRRHGLSRPWPFK